MDGIPSRKALVSLARHAMDNLLREDARPEPNLRRIVGLSNFLDHIMSEHFPPGHPASTNSIEWSTQYTLRDKNSVKGMTQETEERIALHDEDPPIPPTRLPVEPLALSYMASEQRFKYQMDSDSDNDSDHSDSDSSSSSDSGSVSDGDFEQAFVEPNTTNTGGTHRPKANLVGGSEKVLGNEDVGVNLDHGKQTIQVGEQGWIACSCSQSENPKCHLLLRHGG